MDDRRLVMLMEKKAFISELLDVAKSYERKGAKYAVNDMNNGLNIGSHNVKYIGLFHVRSSEEFLDFSETCCRFLDRLVLRGELTHVGRDDGELS